MECLEKCIRPIYAKLNIPDRSNQDRNTKETAYGHKEQNKVPIQEETRH